METSGFLLSTTVAKSLGHNVFKVLKEKKEGGEGGGCNNFCSFEQYTIVLDYNLIV